MWKQLLVLGLSAAVVAAAPSLLRSEEACNCSPLETKQWTFDSKEALAGWTVTGDVGFDNSKSREGRQGALRVGPGGKALLKLRDKDGSGKVEIWVYDDGTAPDNAKAHRVGPRWGLVENDGKVLAAGILYARLPRRRRGLHRHRLQRQGLVQPVVLAGREADACRLAPVDLRLRSRGGPSGLPQRQGARRRRSRQGRLEGLHLHRHLGRPERRPRRRTSGSPTSP